MRYASGQTDKQTDRQTYIHTDMVIAILHTPSGRGGEVIIICRTNL